MLRTYYYILFLLSLVLMMTCVQSDVVLEELPPQEEDRHDLFKRFDVSSLDLRRIETFLWGGKYPSQITYHSREMMLTLPRKQQRCEHSREFDPPQVQRE